MPQNQYPVSFSACVEHNTPWLEALGASVPQTNMIATYEIVKRLYIWFVLAISVVPRQHIDRTKCSVGGDLSRPFRRLLLFLVALNFIRMVLKDSNIPLEFRIVADVLGILQHFGTSFLCFLTPYILQKFLVPFVNIGGRPGANLMTPLYITTILNVLSVVLVRKVHPNWWSLRKLGNVVSSPPVLDTLKVFNTVTTRGGHHSGRGSILSQSLAIVEYWFLTTQFLCAIGFALDRRLEDPSQETQLDLVLSAFREISFVSEWTRILGHSLFINQLDELFLSTPTGGASSHDAATAETTSDDGDDVDIEIAAYKSEIVSLVQA